MHPRMTRAFAVTLNALGLYALALILAAAFAAQLLLHELPCPLCLLQRLQFTLLAIGPILNVRWGPRPSHYALSLLAAIVGRGFFNPPDPAAHPSRRCRLRYCAARLSLLHAGLDRFCHRHRAARGDAAVRPPVRSGRCRTTRCARRVRDGGRVAGDWPHRRECGVDTAGMRFWRMRGKSCRVRVTQAPNLTSTVPDAYDHGRCGSARTR
jgi:hypothetical protein